MNKSQSGSSSAPSASKKTSETRTRRKGSSDLSAAAARDPQLEGLLEAGRELGDRVETFVRERPLVAMASATAVGALLGGVVFSKAGRLVFLAAAGALATEVWKSEGKLDIRGLLDKLTREDDERAPQAADAPEGG